MSDLNYDPYRLQRSDERKLAVKKRLREKSGKGPSRAKAQREPVTSIAKVESDRSRKNSRVKGNRGELDVAKMFSLWSGEIVKRTPGSGGWGGAAEFGTTADLVCRKKSFPFHVECFTGDTLVLTFDGYRPISEVKVGDKVMTHEGRWRKVTHVHERDADVVSLMHGASTIPIWMTPDHPVETFDDWCAVEATNHTSHLTKFANAVVIEREWLSTISGGAHPLRTKLPSRVPFDGDLCYLLGLYLAEGHCSKDRVTWTFHRDEKDLHDVVVREVKAKFGIVSKRQYRKKAKVCAIVACGASLSDTFKAWCGTGSRVKRLGWLIGVAFHEGRHLLRGLFQGDGHIAQHDASYWTMSKALAFDVQALLMRYGIISYVGVNARGLHKVNVARSCLDLFGRIVDLPVSTPDTDDHYKRTFVTDVPDRHRVYFHDPKVRGRKRCRVYNLTVDQDETYVVQGNLVVHNCKHREGWTLDDLVTGAREDHDKSIVQWWTQCLTSCPADSDLEYLKVPLLVFRRNRQPWLVMVRNEDVKKHEARTPMERTVVVKRFGTRVCMLDDLLKRWPVPKGLKNHR